MPFNLVDYNKQQRAMLDLLVGIKSGQPAMNTFEMVRKVLAGDMPPPDVYKTFDFREWMFFASIVGVEAYNNGWHPQIIARDIHDFVLIYKESRDIALAVRLLDYERLAK